MPTTTQKISETETTTIVPELKTTGRSFDGTTTILTETTIVETTTISDNEETTTTHESDLVTEYTEKGITTTDVPWTENTKRPSTRVDTTFETDYYDPKTTMVTSAITTTVEYETTTTSSLLVDSTTTNLPTVIETTTFNVTQLIDNQNKTVNETNLKKCNASVDCAINENCIEGRCYRVCDPYISNTNCLTGINHIIY